jgi:tripartite-type tricarboxylate transporter receptor subunit TctC
MVARLSNSARKIGTPKILCRCAAALAAYGLLPGAFAQSASTGSGLAASTGSGQAWPTKPLRLVVPLAAGGNMDTVTRTIAQKLTESLGQQVVVENRPGVNSVAGTEFVARTAADGYTYLMMSNTFLITPILTPNVPYDPLRDFTGVTLIAWFAQAMVVHPSLPAKSVQDLIALAKAHPGAINYASAGTSSVGDLATVLFNRQAGIRMNPIPYKGNSLALIDVVGGQVSLMLGAIGPALPYVKSGRLRALGVSSPRRSPLLADVPTIAETLPGYEASLFTAMVAPSGTPREIIARVHGEIVRIVQSPEVSNRLVQQGLELAVSRTPDEFTAFIKSDYARWAKVIRDAGIRAE